ncbi:pyridoxamine kinase [Acidaminococcus sp.]|uniref:pyridoxamine kinase n=1 Tax=Acidaminococcus sp. TaxID=1872103 RepID=UPI003D7DD8EA
MKIKRVLAIHDLCSFGRCSLTAAIPVLSAMGNQVCPFPTALYSNNLTYGKFVSRDLTDLMPGYMDQWQELQLPFDAIYSGFLAGPDQVEAVISAIDRFAADDQLVIVDPAMGDDGNLYPVFDETMVEAMKKLVARAGVITPNYTEACLLTGTPYKTDAPTDDDLDTLCEKLLKLGPRAVVVTSVPCGEGKIRIASMEKNSLFPESYWVTKQPFATCGTGDVFTSALAGYLLNGRDLTRSVQEASDFLSFVIDTTLKAGTDPHEGVVLEGCLWKLLVPQTKNCTTCMA